MVHNSKALSAALANFIVLHLEVSKSLFEISDVKRDGTVFVKFRSDDAAPAATYTENFAHVLQFFGKDYVQTDDNKVRLALEQFK
jgi:hypothetical protein